MFDDTVIWWDTLGNYLTAGSYFIIPMVMTIWVWRFRARLYFQESILFLHFALFVILCGASHLVHIWNWTHADYREESWLAVALGIVSLTSVLNIALFMWKRFQ